MTEEINFIARFEGFLKSYKTEEGDTPYYDAIGRLSLENLISVSIDFNHLLTFDPDLAAATKEDPKRAIDGASAAISRILRIVDPDYSETIENLHARFKEVPDRVSVRFIRAEHIGQLIMVDALVTRVSDVKPLLVEGVFQCRQCQEIIYVPQANQFMAPTLCTNDACRSKGPFELIPERSKFVDWQKIRLQEKPEELPPGALPRALDCILQEDLVDIARPGDPCRVVGILRSTQDVTARSRRKAPTFSVFLATNYVAVSEREADRVEIEPKEEEEIRELAQDPLIHRKLVNSIAPSIYGLTDIKEAVCLLLFGGVTKTLADGMKIRGDSNILLVGDPGTAKSQLLKYVAQIAPRGLYTSGKGSTAAGLTAAVLRDPDTEGFALEAGALVLADRGTACIDEFDKMRPQDRTAIHEAMEQHSYHPSTEILLADGSRVQIGPLVDELLAHHSKNVVKGIDCEILDASSLGLEIHTLDRNKVQSIAVDRISRHPAPDYFYRITYSNGRFIVVTPEHPVFIFEGGSIITKPAADIQVGSFIPAPRVLPYGHNPGAVLVNDILLHHNAKLISLPERLTHYVARLLGYFVSEGYSYNGSSAELGFSNSSPEIIEDIMDLMRSQFKLEGIDYTHRNRTLRFISSQLRDFFQTNFTELLAIAKHKRVPPQVFVSGKKAVQHFLKAAFLGDGSLESEAVSYRTSSYGLACDYQDLLLSLRIQSRINHDIHNDSYKVYIRGSSLPLFFELIVEKWDPRKSRISKLVTRSQKSNYHHDVFPASIGIQIKKLYQKLGIPYQGTFYRAIQENRGITRTLLLRHLEEARMAYQHAKTAIEKIPTSIRTARVILRWSQQTAANKISRTRSFINYMERGGYNPDLRNEILFDLVTVIREELAEVASQLDELENLLKGDMGCLHIKTVEKLENSQNYACKFVYDVTVEPTHQFLSHGLLLHNTVSIAKAGIVATLNARTAILAAANPNLGRYVPERSFSENINLPVTLVSRFDLIFVLTDLPETERDERTADHIIQLHQLKGTAKDPPIRAELLRKYIAYARRSITPTLTDEALNVVKEFYLGMRKSGERENAPVPITARQLESLIRLAEAHAKMALRDKVLAEDAQAAVRLVQVTLQELGFDRETGQYDIDNIMIGRAKSQRDRLQAILAMIRELEKETPDGVPIDKLVERAQLDGISADFVRQAIIQLRDKDGLIFEPRPDKLKYIKGA